MKLNQVIAIEKSTKNEAHSQLTALHHAYSKDELFNGFRKSYQKKDDNGDMLPPESKKVQMTAPAALTQVEDILAGLFDVTAQKETANCTAFADVKVDGQVIMEKAPVTYLLFLEKQINDLRTFVDKLPVLSRDEDWMQDENTKLWKTEPTTTHRSKKNQKAIVLYPATEQHPAQTQLISEDEVVGFWHTTKESGALPIPRKEELVKRINKLGEAVKVAREEANSVEAPPVRVAQKIFGYLFS